jgi:uncharacterized protein
MTAPTTGSERAFRRFGEAVATWPRLTLALSLVLAAACAALAMTRLRIDTDQDELVSSTADYYKRYKLDYLGSFPESEYAYVAIDVAHDPARALAFARDLTARLRGLPGVVFARHGLDLSALRAFPLHLVPDADLALARERLVAARDELPALVAARDLGDLLGTIVERTSELALQARDEEPGDRVAFAFLDGLLADAERALRGEAPVGAGADAFFPGARADARLEFFDVDPREDPEGRQARFLFVAVQVERDYSTLAAIEEPLRHIREALDATRAAHPGVQAGLTGKPILTADELTTTNRDMTIATAVAFAAVALVFMLAFRSVWRPLLVMATLAVAIAWTYGFAAVSIGTLNLLSLVFTVILIGLGSDFGVHVLARYAEGRARGLSPRDAAIEAQSLVGPGNLTASTTTAVAFLSTLLVDFRGLAELGQIAGVGIMACAVAMHTTLPAALVAFDRADARVSPPVSYAFLTRLERRPRLVLTLGLLACALLALPAARLRFDTALLDLNDPDLESVQWERRITHEARSSSWFAVFLLHDLEAARALTERLRARGDTFELVETPIDLVPAPGRMAALADLAAALEPARFTPAPTRALGDTVEAAAADRARVAGRLRELEGLLRRLEETARAARAGDEALEALVELRGRAARLAGALLELPADPAHPGWRALSSWQRELLDGLKGAVDALVHPRPLGLADLPPEVTERVVGKAGLLAVIAYPTGDLWDPAQLDAFYEEITRVDPQVTGGPVMVHRSIEAMRRGFVVALVYAAAIVVALVALDLRRPLDVLLAMGSTGLSLLAGAGAAVLWGVNLNLANFYAVPILVGIGVDSGVHLVHRWREDPTANPAVGPTGAAISLTSATTLIGFGSLIFASHRGLASFGKLCFVGTATGLAVSLLLLPPVLTALGRRKTPT